MTHVQVRAGAARVAQQGLAAQDALATGQLALQLGDLVLVDPNLLRQRARLEVGLLECDGQGVHLGRPGLDLGLGWR